ncbi:MAG: putative Holliday junction resolvase [Streptosporangiaceae bacterium]|nr:putative Holliday junction resolvase [Streptosporangiaceae bacterium]
MSAAGDALVVIVYGKPVTQGSKTRTKWGIRDDNADRLRPWREAVKTAALDVLCGRERLEGPVSVDVVFTFDRPRSAPKSRPCWPITRSSGDLDKLERAVFDALTDAGVWRDDSQVVDVRARKVHVGDDRALHIPGAVLAVSAR